MARWERRDGKGLLSESQQSRYERAGVTHSDYNAGRNLQKARGHGSTPEHPGRDNPARKRARAYAALDRDDRIEYWPDDEGEAFWAEYEDSA